MLPVRPEPACRRRLTGRAARPVRPRTGVAGPSWVGALAGLAALAVAEPSAAQTPSRSASDTIPARAPAPVGAGRITVRVVTIPRDTSGAASDVPTPAVPAAGAPTAGAPVPDAGVRSGRVGAQTDGAGRATLVLAPGPRTVIVAKIGYAPDSLRLQVRLGLDTTVTVALRPLAAALSGVVVSATRTGRPAETDPTRVEVVEPEDVGEKVAMTPGSARMVLSEAPGVRVVTTAPALGAASVRLQGLRGRYTALLTDGLPLLGASTEGLGLLQVPPVDLDHVEVIKGAASALYGGAALGGVVNFVSRRPARDETDLIVNQTSRDASDVVLWTADSVDAHWGYTVLAGAHRQRAQDLTGTGWTDIAGYGRGEVRPRVTGRARADRHCS